MHRTHVFLGGALLALTLVVATVGAQTPAPAAPPAGRGQGAAPPPQAPRGRGPATFPAQQRPPADPAVAARGKMIYEGNCQMCHAPDLRGAAGPNLLRSGNVLADKGGDLLAPIIRGSLAPRMPAINMSDEDIRVLTVYLHEVQRTMRQQGRPPIENVPVTPTVVGNAAAGKTFFDATCASCHSVTGDLANIGNRMPDARTLQNLWVSGGAIGGRGRGRAGAPGRGTPTVTVTMPNGSTVQGVPSNIDDFHVIVQMADGTLRTIRRAPDVKVVVTNPLDRHIAILSELTDKNMHDVTAYLVTVK
jgi:cytochrome c oxidase cbb3-type subunit 3